MKKILQDKKKRKIIIGVLIGIIILLSIAIVLKVTLKDNKKKEKTEISSKLKADTTFGNLNIVNVDFISNEKITHLMADVYNNGDETFTARMVNIVFIDYDSKEMGKTSMYLSEIPSKESIRIDAVVDKKYSKAYKYKIVEE